jgi:arginase family enzyme
MGNCQWGTHRVGDAVIPPSLVLNAAFVVEDDGDRRYLVNDKEGVRLNLTEKVDQAIAYATQSVPADTAAVDRNSTHSNVLKYLLRLKVLVEPEHEATAASGISRTSQVPIGESWVGELRHLARWVVVGCAAAFSSTEFGNPATGMLPVRRGLQKLLRPEPLWSYDTQTDLGVGATLALDYGDIIHRPIVDRALDVHDRLRFATRQIQAFGGRPLLIGGDHSLTYPVVAELAQSVPGLRVVHFDAHADRRPLDTGSITPDCGNFIEHLLHRFPDLHILTIGVRGWTAHHLVTGSHYCYITAAEVINGHGAASVNRFCDGHPVYLTTDIDVLDPSVAPEVAYACPAGLTLPQLQTLISVATRSAESVVGADFVEVCQWSSGRNLAAMAQVCAIATLLDNDRSKRDTCSVAATSTAEET